MSKKINIPKIPHAFFRWYCKKERYEELHGDLEEFYYERAEDKGLLKARMHYLFDVIRCCQPYAWKKSKGQTNPNIMMINNYFKTSFRNSRKNPLNAFINVFGLSAAIGICLIAYSFLEWEYNLDQFHENKREVYLTTFFSNRDGSIQHYGMSPKPLGEMLKADFAQIKKVCRLQDQNVVVKNEDKVFHEQVRYSDPEFLEMFTFPLKWGSPASLADLNSIILSDEMSIKYFGEKNPIGQDILIIFGKDNKKVFKVSGVAEPFPKAHAIEFDFLVNFENLQIADPGYNPNDWSGFVTATLIQVADPSDMEPIVQGMEKYLTLHSEGQDDWTIASFDFVRLEDLNRRSGQIRNDISFGYPPQKFVLPIIAMLILALACFNYINIAIVSATKRLKEIGLRKTIGASRGQVIFQFLAENIMITFFALVVGVMLSAFIMIPWFNRLFESELELKLIDTKLWMYLLFILLFTGVASGLYPALYISRFRVVKIFKGSVRFGTKNPLTKVFLALQLILTCLCITCGITLTQNTFYLNNRSWGYDQDAALYAVVDDYGSFTQLQTAMLQQINVLSLSGSEHHLGKVITNAAVEMPDQQYQVRQLSVDENYFETMGLSLKEGRVFNGPYPSDKTALIVNETLVRNMDLTQPIGQTLKIDSSKYEIIGVLEDFHIYNFEDEIRPTVFSVANPEDFQYLSLQVKNGTEQETYKALQEQWTILFPEIPFQGGYQSEVLGAYVEEAASGAEFLMTVSFIAVMLVSLGWYGLVMLNVAGRTREFSIKKVLGASLRNIASNISRQYALLVTIALLIGIPLSHVTMEAFLGMLYHYHMPITFSPVSVAVMILISVLLIVLATQIYKVSKSNPVEGLKAE
ncbi:ABC transporter permease [Fulvivirgaceae bacterium BMA10]|uniref:ABC transporter permease n=1 Tax=Splendidivirga corallicola TaxID=3051826 RepID=A0ABT8KXI9_9BACT|nr:ABC transporter permease [Fulvivirgaceae bacterium BMA10]